ncbi:hypothetical protein F4804DRAFT_249136 [Jackrogersella minutella]|nr:hypothetical protein F4804DRAFT_249136 [Jackrogersella minutella]
MSLNTSRVVWSTDWTPPAASALNLNPNDDAVCEAAGAWKAANVGAFADNENHITDPDLVMAYLGAILPSDITRPDGWTLLFWYNDLILNELDNTTSIPLPGTLLETISLFPLDNCAADVCKNLDWVGDPDISGRGMLITYYLAAGLITIYLCAITLSKLGFVKRRLPGHSKRIAVVGAFEDSVSAFLDATLIFAVSMLAAACFRLSQAFLQEYGSERGHWMVYASIGSLYMSTFSSLLSLSLQLTAPDIRDHWLRSLLWTFIILLNIVNEVLFDIFFGEVTGDQLKDLEEDIWLLMCNPYQLFENGIGSTLRIAQAQLALNAVGYVLYRIFRSKVERIQGWPRLRAFCHRAFSYIQIFNAVLCFLLMWAMLGIFHWYRDVVNESAGEENQNSDWTFGQVLAVATWVPVLVEFATVLKYGSEEGLNKKIPAKYTVVSNDVTFTHNEKEDPHYGIVETGHQDC